MGSKVPLQVMTAPVNLLILCPDRAKCEGCGGLAGYDLEVSEGGSSFGDTYQHTDKCPHVVCPHGVKWTDWSGCKQCDDSNSPTFGYDETDEKTEPIHLVSDLNGKKG